MAATTTRPKRRRRGASLAAEPGPRRIAIYTRRSTDDEHQPFSICCPALSMPTSASLGVPMLAAWESPAGGLPAGLS